MPTKNNEPKKCNYVSGGYLVMVSFPSYTTLYFRFNSDLMAMSFAEQFKSNIDTWLTKESIPEAVINEMHISIHLMNEGEII